MLRHEEQPEAVMRVHAFVAQKSNQHTEPESTDGDKEQAEKARSSPFVKIKK